MYGTTAMTVIKLMRPQDWAKNLFVLIPVVFGIAARRSETETLPYGEVIALTALTFIAFCLVASAVYCFNDAFDAEKDHALLNAERACRASGVHLEDNGTTLGHVVLEETSAPANLSGAQLPAKGPAIEGDRDLVFTRLRRPMHGA